MTKESQKTEERHLEIMLAIESIRTQINESIKPAATQAWKNEKDIVSLKTKQKLTQYIGGLFASGLIMWLLKGHWFKH